jgi:hypothetical protein
MQGDSFRLKFIGVSIKRPVGLIEIKYGSAHIKIFTTLQKACGDARISDGFDCSSIIRIYMK